VKQTDISPVTKCSECHLRNPKRNS